MEEFIIGVGVASAVYSVWALTGRCRRRRRINRRLRSRAYDIPSLEIVQALRRSEQEKENE